MTEASAPAGRSANGQTTKLLVSALALLAVWLFPTPTGLTPDGQKTLAVLVGAIVLWMTEAIPVAVTALLALALLAIALPGRGTGAVLAGFAMPVLYFYLGITVLGVATVHSGLAERSATLLTRYARGNPGRLLRQLVAAMLPSALVMPSAITRNAMLIPAYESIFRRTGIRPGHPLAARLMLALAVLNPAVSAAYLTGGLAPAAAAAALGGFTWLRWFAFMIVPLVVMLVLSTVALALLYPVPSLPPGVAADSAAARSAIPPLSRHERFALVVMAATSALWLTDFWHGFNPAIPALVGAVAVLWPGKGILSWREFERSSSWSTFVVLGTVFSFTGMLEATGATRWLAGVLVSALTPVAGHSALVILGVVWVGILIHLVVPNIAAAVTLLIPLTAQMAGQMGYSPLVLGLATLMATNAITLYPAQTVTTLQAQEGGWIRTADLLRLGAVMILVVYLVTWLVAVPWWSLLGAPLR